MLPKENQKVRENDENQEKPVLMEDVGNLWGVQILEKFGNMKSSFLTEVKHKLSHNTETTNNTDFNTSVIKTSHIDFSIENSNEKETDLSNNTDK